LSSSAKPTRVKAPSVDDTSTRIGRGFTSKPKGRRSGSLGAGPNGTGNPDLRNPFTLATTPTPPLTLFTPANGRNRYPHSGRE
jgi:hypothetical protein